MNDVIIAINKHVNTTNNLNTNLVKLLFLNVILNRLESIFIYLI